MSDSSTDDKIELLVHSVLEAVDQRLARVREQVAAAAAESTARYDELKAALADLDRRTAARPADTAVGIEHATQMLLERIEAMHQRDRIATNERFAELNAALDQLRTKVAAARPAEVTSPPEERLAPLPPVSPTVVPRLPTVTAPVIEHEPAAPVVADNPPPITAPTPITALVDLDAVTASLVTGEQPAVPDGIDLDRLTSLLTERLGNLHLGAELD